MDDGRGGASWCYGLVVPKRFKIGKETGVFS